jgi:hypothetical protein
MNRNHHYVLIHTFINTVTLNNTQRVEIIVTQNSGMTISFNTLVCDSVSPVFILSV